jgi:hypothetical protein
LLKITSFPILCFSFRIPILTALSSVLALSAITVNGQSKQQQTAVRVSEKQPARREILPDQFGNSWRATGPAKQMSAEQFRVVQDAEVYLEYGLQTVTTRAYTSGRDQVSIEVFEMRYPSGAYGLYTFNRGLLPAGREEFQAGRYVVRISRTTETPASDQSLINLIRQHLPESGSDLSPLPSHLPDLNKVAESEKYLAGPAALAGLRPFADLGEMISFTGGAEAVTAEYENGGARMSLIIVDCYTPQLAADNYARLKNQLESFSPEEKSSRLLKRIGNYVVEAVGVRDTKAAEAVLKQIKYAPRVYWEGDRFNSIPFEYRPPDPLALEEARRTGAFLVTIFYMIGMMILGSFLLGVIAGGSFFYWRRYRRRKLGFEDAFSDAGGTIRLNLDDFLLPAADESRIKLLEKRD